LATTPYIEERKKKDEGLTISRTVLDGEQDNGPRLIREFRFFCTRGKGKKETQEGRNDLKLRSKKKTAVCPKCNRPRKSN